MAIIPSEQVVGPTEHRDTTVSRKPRALGGRKIHPYTFLSGKTLDEDLEKQLERINFDWRQEHPVGEPSQIRKLDNCRFDRQKSHSALRTTWRDPTVRKERLAVKNELMTIRKNIARSGTPLRRLRVKPRLGKVLTRTSLCRTLPSKRSRTTPARSKKSRRVYNAGKNGIQRTDRTTSRSKAPSKKFERRIGSGKVRMKTTDWFRTSSRGKKKMGRKSKRASPQHNRTTPPEGVLYTREENPRTGAGAEEDIMYWTQ